MKYITGELKARRRALMQTSSGAGELFGTLKCGDDMKYRNFGVENAEKSGEDWEKLENPPWKR